MQWVVYLFGSGLVFFLAVGFFLVALAIFYRSERRWLKSLATILTLIGLFASGLSGTPLPYWFYGVAAAGTLAWLFAEHSARLWFQRHRARFRLLALTLWAVGVALEAPYQWTPRAAPHFQHDLYVIGDSVSAGVGQETWTWPRLLSDSGEMRVHDFSRMGATVSSALKQTEGLSELGGIVVLEIGGNDLLGSTTPEAFDRDLAELLGRVCAPDRVVLMFELPSLPLANNYGRIQRRLAAEHGVALIPKRVLMGVLTGGGATLDSVHLSKQGHEKMAAIVRSLIGPPFQD